MAPMTAPVPEHLPAPVPQPATPTASAHESEQAIPPALTSVRWRLEHLNLPRPTWSRFYVFAHLKGGSGKSTSAGTIALRLAEHTGQPVLAIDIDTRSQTLTMWRAAAGDAWPGSVRVETWPVADLETRIGAALAADDAPVHVVVDSGGHDVTLLMAAIKAGRFPRRAPGFPTVSGVDVIVPLMPSDADVVPITTTVDVATAAARNTAVRLRAVLTRVGPAGVRDQDYVRATTAMAAAGLPWTDTYISFLKKHLRAPSGTIPKAVRNYDAPRDDDAGQYDALLAELLADEPLDVIA
jgi:hypothetical protein